MINTDPALILNRITPDPLSPAVPITVDTPCPLCGTTPLNSQPQMTGIKETILSHCDLFAVQGDDTWVNRNSCEVQDPRPFLRTRIEAIRKRSVSA
jgi:hypothetical protein